MREREALAALAAVHGGRRASELESVTLDFKSGLGSPQDAMKGIADASLCFANANGGVVVVGIDDKQAGPPAFLGTALSRDDVQRRVYELSRPALTVDVQELPQHGVRLLCVFVPQSPDIHSDPQGRAPARVGTDCQPMDPSQQARLREERQGIDWSSRPSESLISSVDPVAVAEARRRLASFVDDRRGMARLPETDLLRQLGVVSGKNLLRAGELLFCDGPNPPALVYQYRATPGGDPKSVERLSSSLLVAFNRLLELVQARRNLAPIMLPGGQQIQIEDFPELAVREAVANAVIHRDYHLLAPVTVEHSPEVFVVTSPGPLVSGVTPSNILTHPSKPRNPLLARVARTLGLAEEVGRGVDRMFREMIRSGRDVPRIESMLDSVRVSFVGGAPNTNVARFVAQLPDEERDDTDALLIVFKLCTARSIRAAELAPVLQKTEEEAEAILRRLAGDHAGMLEPTRATARTARPSYRFRAEALRSLGSAVRYQRRTVDDIDRKVIAHVSEYGHVTNRTLQNMLDVGLQRAKAILADLVQRGILVKTSAHERGPGVEYGKGVKFPASKRKGPRSRPGSH